MINKGEALLVDRSPIAKLSLLTAKLTLTAVKASAKGVATLPTEAHLLPKAAALVEAPSTSSSTAERSGAKAIATAKASTETITTDQVATTEASTVRRKAASAGSESVVGVSEARRSRGAGHSSNPSLRADDVRLLRYRGRREASRRRRSPRSSDRCGRWSCCRASTQSCRSRGHSARPNAWAGDARTSASRDVGGGTNNSGVGAGHYRGWNS
jgi:hypothetical protein